MIRITILLLFFSLSSAAQDSVTIKGKLFDKTTNTPVIGATVRVQLKFSGIFITSVVCDSIGQFSFKASRSLEDEFIDIIYSDPGYKTETWTLTGVVNIDLGVTTLERIRPKEKY